ncbi:MAG TPA: DJ-1/PfpI family protein [Kiloniellales bacterium]|nr:DJ-1/PfpI family protein [Kiloniellales bacterium]
MNLSNKRIAILANDGFEQSELLEPLNRLKESGATVEVVSPSEGSIRGWNKDDWGESVPVDRAVTAANVDDFDALILPGGQINPDLLRTDQSAGRLY